MDDRANDELQTALVNRKRAFFIPSMDPHNRHRFRETGVLMAAIGNRWIHYLHGLFAALPRLYTTQEYSNVRQVTLRWSLRTAAPIWCAFLYRWPKRRESRLHPQVHWGQHRSDCWHST